MTTTLTAPAPGTPVRADLLQRIIAAIRENTILNGVGYRTRRTPNGLMLEIDAVRRPSAYTPLPTCFEYGTGNPGEGNRKRYGRPYFMIGSRLYRAADADVNCSESAGIDYLEISVDNSVVRGVVKHCADFSALQALADNLDKSVFPLYEIGESGSPVADLRTIVQFNEWEYDT